MVQKSIKNGSSDESSSFSSQNNDSTPSIKPSLVYSRNDKSLKKCSDDSFSQNQTYQTIYDNYSDLINEPEEEEEEEENISNHFDISKQRRNSSDTRFISAQLSQWNYNNNKAILNRVINHVLDLINQIQTENDKRPIHIVLSNSTAENNIKLCILDLNIKIDGTYNINNSIDPSNFNTKVKDKIIITTTTTTTTPPPPSLPLPIPNHNNNNSNNNNNLFDLDRNALSKLFKLKLTNIHNHLKSLQERVDDVSSKVFITGDVNTGKSSFCNSLLKRKLLPEDQLPCTNVFCEILEARDNGNVEEIHAILNDKSNNKNNSTLFKYSIKDKSTYEVHQLSELDDLVQRNDKYKLLKVYIKDDKRDPEESLLRNGTVDISLIDSPGLNIDSIQTAEVMTKQEEIDLVIFVVNAENQLTLSAQDFIKVASREKKLMFFVIKKFDKIKDKQRCKQLILNQIQNLSPETYKNGKDFIHFLEKDLDQYPFNTPTKGNPDPDDSDDSDDPDDGWNDPDFENLENSLRNFVLKKRSMSKLLPAKTFLLKILNDLEIISKYNIESLNDETKNINDELNKLLQDVIDTKSHYDKFIKKIDTLVETTITNVYNKTKENIDSSLSFDINNNYLPKYQGLSKIYDYVIETERFIKSNIQESILNSESNARQQTDLAVQNIYTLVRNNMDPNFMEERQFDSNRMFMCRYHLSAKQFDVHIHLSDLYAPSWEKFLEYIGVPILLNPISLNENTKTTNKNSDLEKQLVNKQLQKNNELGTTQNTLTTVLGLTLYPLTKYMKQPSLIFTSKLPTLAIYSFGGSQIVKAIVWNGIQTFSFKTLTHIAGSTIVVSCLLGISYLVYDLPRALPLNLANRYKQKLTELNFSHINAKRVSQEVATVLKVPTREIVKTCEIEVNKKESTKYDLEAKRDKYRISLTFFEHILNATTTQKAVVEGLDLEVD
ncbi:hypothetical protein RI543_003658 [Arxiozyma heterogenica]|uniref:Dynamin-type G domain-containing protein n=1 Tax=Arxiozyma heterogenica TaxID=278026 RepID=A0AAN7WSG8_9SACH|nr:hypothetical protein RI543_003658 [Kazachstania heterogenica]